MAPVRWRLVPAVTSKLRDFVAMQRARGMSDEAIRRALGLSRAQVAEAGILSSESEAGADDEGAGAGEPVARGGGECASE